MSKKHDLDGRRLSIIGVERGAIVIKDGDRLDERRWRKWERLENGFENGFRGQELGGKTFVLDVNFPGNVDRQGHPCQLWTEIHPPPSPSPQSVFYDFLRSQRSSTASSSPSTMALGSFFSMKEYLSLPLPPPPFYLSLSSSRLQSFVVLQGRGWGVGSFMPIALDKVFKAR